MGRTAKVDICMLFKSVLFFYEDCIYNKESYDLKDIIVCRLYVLQSCIK